jgi:hypothetical protein
LTIPQLTAVLMRKRYPRFALLLLSLLCATQARGDQDFIVGVSTHVLEDGGPLARPLRLMLEAGIGSVRDEALWSIAEERPGELQIIADWPRYLDALQEKSLQSLLLLDADNPGYAHNDGAHRAFTRYIDYLSQAFRGQVSFYELGNDWNNPASSEAYVRRVKDSAARLRRNDPQAKILAGAINSDALDQGVAEPLIKAGLLDSIDGLSLRPFVACRKALGAYTPESWIHWLDEFDKRLTAQAGHAVPLYLTSMGWPTGQENCGVSENTQAAFLARSFLLARSRPDIKGMWWAELADSDAPQRTQQLGLLRSDLSEKPAYDVLKVIAPLMTRYRYKADSQPSRDLGRNNLYLMDFTTDDDHLLAAWAIGQARQIKIETRNDVQGAVQLIDTRQPRRGRFDSDSHWVCQEHRCTAVITLSEFPQIISLGKPSWLFTR